MAVFAISYDPVAVLADFAQAHGITFHLLSDEGSREIQRLGLLNRHVADQQAFFGMPVKERHHGIPYPGTFLLDEGGVVTAKHFEQSYRERPSGEFLLPGAGVAAERAAVKATARDEGVEIVAWSGSGRFRPLQKTLLRVRIGLAAGRHLYVPPVPDGYVPLLVDVEQQEGVRSWPPQLPAGTPHRIRGLDEEFRVVVGTVELAVPFMVAGRRYHADGRPRREPLHARQVDVVLTVDYQTCTDDICSAPRSRRLNLPLTEEDLVD